MIQGNWWELQDDQALSQLDAAAVRLLNRGGVRIEHEHLLRTLERAGCSIEWNTRRCRFPEQLIRDALAHFRQTLSPGITLPAGWSPQQTTRHEGSYPHLLEWPSGERRLATRKDVTDMVKLAHAMPEFTSVGKVLTCCEVDQRVEPLWAALQLAQLTDKRVVGGEIFSPEYIEPLVRMGEVLTGQPGDTSLLAACDFFIAPLVLDGKQAACLLEKRRFGLPHAPGTMPISGISAPVTIAGTVAICVAELLAGWTIGYVIAPELPAVGIVSSGSFDLRTATACFGSPEALLQDVTTAQLCRRLYGLEVGVVTNYVDCKHPGFEAAFQKLFPLLSMPFGYGVSEYGHGLLSAGQDYSPVQHLLDMELQGAVHRFLGNFEVNSETLAVELIEEMMRRDRATFIEEEHTLTHYLQEQWYPRWLDRTYWQGTEYERASEERMMARIDAHIKETIAHYQPPSLEAARISELRRIFLAYEQQLLGSNVTPLDTL